MNKLKNYFNLYKLNKRDPTIEKQSPYHCIGWSLSTLLWLTEILELRKWWIIWEGKRVWKIYDVSYYSTRQLFLYYKTSFVKTIGFCLESFDAKLTIKGKIRAFTAVLFSDLIEKYKLYSIQGGEKDQSKFVIWPFFMEFIWNSLNILVT